VGIIRSCGKHCPVIICLVGLLSPAHAWCMKIPVARAGRAGCTQLLKLICLTESAILKFSRDPNIQLDCVQRTLGNDHPLMVRRHENHHGTWVLFHREGDLGTRQSTSKRNPTDPSSVRCLAVDDEPCTHPGRPNRRVPKSSLAQARLSGLLSTPLLERHRKGYLHGTSLSITYEEATQVPDEYRGSAYIQDSVTADVAIRTTPQPTGG